jgi:ABC-type lipoprotein release transport system permease subunit
LAPTPSVLYGTLSYAVTRRTNDIGIRVALGAQQGQVLWMVLKSALLLVLGGIAIGLPAALAAQRLTANDSIETARACVPRHFIKVRPPTHFR